MFCGGESAYGIENDSARSRVGLSPVWEVDVKGDGISPGSSSSGGGDTEPFAKIGSSSGMASTSMMETAGEEGMRSIGECGKPSGI